ncbi:IPT/TIG domain-containing protein [Sphingobacterium arenae]|uniref:IPT/TIG domain-containing protein n=1 Tax=Sphingobacterium arenae TaxID=1280598 RepID=A0ABR7Y434_9SPHI|nr:IPT/TIG domain-containing protein [Sphingobacterium arenae]MBD1426070.1 IPT/TIG domain-containing protein [Sphingobacterium arenae]
MKTLKAVKFFIVLALCTLIGAYSCKKEEKLIHDSKPIEIKTLPVSNLSSVNATLSAEIVHLNDEDIREYGFIFYINTHDSIIFRMDTKAKPGLFTFDYRPTTPFKIKGYYGYRAYLKTDHGEYSGTSMAFALNTLGLNNYGTLQATLGEEIVLHGDFAQIEEDHQLWLGYPIQHTVPFQIDADQKTLTFKMPLTIQNNYNPVPLQLQQRGQLIHHFASIMVLPTLNPPAAGPHYYSDPIRLTAVGLPEYIQTNFRVIIGDKFLPYQSTYHPYELGISGDAYRIGYYNGRDTVIFDQPWQLIHPDTEAIDFFPKIVHPKTVITAGGINFYKHYVYNFSETTIGNIATFASAGDNSFEREIYVPDLPSGQYDITMKTPMYQPQTLKQKITVTELKITDVDLGEGYFNDPIVIKGNFLPEQDYIVRIGEREAFKGKALDGELRSELPFMELGNFTVFIGYLSQQMDMYIANKDHTIQMKGGTIDSFYPKKGYPGDIITIKGKGLRSSHFGFSIGTSGANIVYRKDGEAKIMVPNTDRKGPHRLSMGAFNDWIFSDEYFEVL